MPLITQIERDGENIELRWGDFHIAAMIIASEMDSGSKKLFGTWRPKGTMIEIDQSTSFSLVMYPIIAASKLGKGSYTLKSDWTFRDVMDGEVLELKAGDVLKAWRSF